MRVATIPRLDGSTYVAPEESKNFKALRKECPGTALTIFLHLEESALTVLRNFLLKQFSLNGQGLLGGFLSMGLLHQLTYLGRSLAALQIYLYGQVAV